MKKTLLTICFLAVSIIVFAQEPGNNLGKTLYQMRQEFPDAINSGL